MKVKIHRPAKNAMQSGHGKSCYWLLEPDSLTKRTPEPLMGWTSSGDTLNQIKLRFDSAEDAVAFAQEKGWDYTVIQPHERRVVPRNYSDNFKYIPPAESA